MEETARNRTRVRGGALGSRGDGGEKREKQPILRVLKVLKEHGGPFSQRKLASLAGVSVTTAGNWLRGLERIGLVRRVEIEEKGEKKTRWVSELRPFPLKLETLKSVVEEAIEKLYYEHGLEPPDKKVIEDFIRSKLAEAERRWPLRT
jgi:DNA-binding MarR family transcriptional regulator